MFMFVRACVRVGANRKNARTSPTALSVRACVWCVREEIGSNVREQRERVKKGSGSSVNKKRGRDVRWRRVSVGEKRESAAKQSNELACQCACVTPL